MNCKHSLILGSCIAAAVAGLAGSAIAQDKPAIVYGQRDELVQVRHVSYADLNLASKAGQSTLYHRVSGAVDDVCEDATGPTALTIARQQCRKFAWRGAKPQMDRAFQRAAEIAQAGHSSIEATAIQIAVLSR